ncbi:MAG TPA: DNA polymerase IV [Methanomicrobia archaeon]|nr:DNA polymerase IV [Methanomicrobia archaeon]
MKVILHVDMDSFFSAVEMREQPELRGKPVVVGGRIPPKAELETGAAVDKRRIRGVVSTCSYEAREFGVHSAMPLSQAYQLCPDAIFLPVNMALYNAASQQVMRILRAFADRFEQVSIDEAYLDISSRVHDWQEARAYAQRIKQEIADKAGLSCSLGIAPNKIVAKIASDFEKPDGLTVVDSGNAATFLAPLPVKKIPGVGPKTAATLNQMGIATIHELAIRDVQELVARFGKYGWRLHQVAHGIDERDVEEKRARKSLSRETTLEEHTSNPELLNRCIDALAERVHEHLVREGFGFKTVAIKVKFDDFSVHTRAKTFRALHTDCATIAKTAKELLRDFIGESAGEKRVRLIGVRVSTLGMLDAKQRRFA